jgi:hypothetical protein
MPCECIDMCFRECIYDEILTNSIAFTIFGVPLHPLLTA